MVNGSQKLFLLHAPIDGHSIWLFPASIGPRFNEFADVSWKLADADTKSVMASEMHSVAGADAGRIEATARTIKT
jgi:hypothetical protein